MKDGEVGMPTEPRKTIMCNACARLECRHGYPRGIPDYCMATGYADILEETKTEYSKPGAADVYLASGKIVNNGLGKWTRIQEAIEFSRELKLTKIGFASCVALSCEAGLIAELFIGAGFQVTCAGCQIGRISPKDRGVTLESDDFRGYYCNPIAQAGILNNAGTELNFMLGLCLGHDIIFTRHSKAPVSTLIVKDRLTGHNPAVAL